MTSVLDEHCCVQAKNTSLIGLGDVSEDDVNHGHEHSVLLWMSSVLNNWDHIGSLLGHIDQITSYSLGEFDGVDCTFGSN